MELPFPPGSRWGFFPSASAGWRISEESFFEPAKTVVDDMKLRVSYGTMGNSLSVAIILCGSRK